MPTISLKAKLRAYSMVPFYNDWVRDLDSQVDINSGELNYEAPLNNIVYARGEQYYYKSVLDGNLYYVTDN